MTVVQAHAKARASEQCTTEATMTVLEMKIKSAHALQSGLAGPPDLESKVALNVAHGEFSSGDIATEATVRIAATERFKRVPSVFVC